MNYELMWKELKMEIDQGETSLKEMINGLKSNSNEEIRLTGRLEGIYFIDSWIKEIEVKNEMNDSVKDILE